MERINTQADFVSISLHFLALAHVWLLCIELKVERFYPTCDHLNMSFIERSSCFKCWRIDIFDSIWTRGCQMARAQLVCRRSRTQVFERVMVNWAIQLSFIAVGIHFNAHGNHVCGLAWQQPKDASIAHLLLLLFFFQSAKPRDTLFLWVHR